MPPWPIMLTICDIKLENASACAPAAGVLVVVVLVVVVLVSDDAVVLVPVSPPLLDPVSVLATVLADVVTVDKGWPLPGIAAGGTDIPGTPMLKIQIPNYMRIALKLNKYGYDNFPHKEAPNLTSSFQDEKYQI